jgi:adenosylcobinamide-phosphate synthase
MSFLSLLAVLVLEHFRPLTHRVQLYTYFARYGNFLERHFNAGRFRYGVLAWSLGVLPPLLVIGLVYWLLYGTLFALLFNVGVLYLTLSCSHLTAQAAEIAKALREDKFDSALIKLGEAEGISPAGLDRNTLSRLAIEKLFVCAHRQLFGVFFWFALLGPVGAALYRLAHILHQKWGVLDHAEYGRFGLFADQVFSWIDWLPVRVTALSFAIMGDFEDAIRCWQEQATNWANKTQGVILAAGAGALGVRLGETLSVDGQPKYRPELGLGEEADADYIDSAVSLIWRTVALWLALLLLFTLAKLAG